MLFSRHKMKNIGKIHCMFSISLSSSEDEFDISDYLSDGGETS